MRSVLVLCTGNSARSQMAEAIINARFGDQWRAESAGTRPTGSVHPAATAALARLGIASDGLRSKSTDEFAGRTFDLVLTVCDSAAEDCPVWLGGGRRQHLSFPDPAASAGDEREQLATFCAVAEDIISRVGALLEQLSAGSG